MRDAQTDAPSEERHHGRYEGHLEGRLLLEGAWWSCWIKDISPGGAGLEPAIPAALGKHVVLSSPSFDFEGEITGRVINVSDNKTCIAFDLDEIMRRRLTMFVITNV